MMRLRTIAMVVLVAAFWTGPTIEARCEQPGAQQAQRIEVKVELRYLLFLPEGYDEENDRCWPMIFFLHGWGETGDDLNKVKIHGPPKIVETNKDFPFIVISPQSGYYGWDPDVLVKLLDHVICQHRVDRQRIYLTGLSMGGYGSWILAAAYPDRFAAVVPICGGGKPETAERLKDLPIWVFHGAKDETVPISRSQRMVDAIEAAGGNVKFTVYPDAGHNSWTETYDNPKLYQWLLEQKRPNK